MTVVRIIPEKIKDLDKKWPIDFRSTIFFYYSW